MQRKLKPRQVRAARMLAFGEKGTYITALLKMRPETLWRWKQYPEFIAVIEKVKREELEAVHYKLENLAQAAVNAVWAELYHYGSDMRRLHAALGVIKMLGIERTLSPEGYEKTRSNSALSAASTSAIDAETPSAASEVTPYSLMPQGTMPA